MLFKKRDPNYDMSFLDHLEALRWHVVRSVLVICTLGLVAFLNKELIFDGIILAPKNTDFWTYRMLCLLGQKLNIDMCITQIDFSAVIH